MAGTVAGAATQSPVLAVGVGVVLLAVVIVVVHRERARLGATIYLPLEQLAERAALAARGVADAAVVADDAPVEVAEVTAGLRALGDRVRAGQALIRRRDTELERYDDDLALLLELARDVTGSANVAYVLRTAARAAMAAGGVDRAVVWLKDEGMLRGRYDTGATDAFSPATAPVALGDGRVGAAAAGNMVVVDPEGRLAPGGEGRGARGAAVPMAVGGRVLGVIELIGESLVELSPQQHWVLELVATHTAAVLHAARLETRADLLGRVDPVTGMANYRQFVSDLAVEVERAARYGRPLCLVLLDLGSSATKPTGSDPAGRRLDDDRLVVAATVVDGESRACDSVYRFSQAELAVLVRESTEVGASAFAERLCRRLREVSADALDGLALEARAGVAELPSPRTPGATGRSGDGSGWGPGGSPGPASQAAAGRSGRSGAVAAGGGGDAEAAAPADGAELLRRAGVALAATSPEMTGPAPRGPVVRWSSLSFSGQARGVAPAETGQHPPAVGSATEEPARDEGGSAA